jgi:hypothetical protein
MKLECGFARVKSVFEDCLEHAGKLLTDSGILAYVEGANAICRLGRGEEPVLVYLEEMPIAASLLGEDVISDVVEYTKRLSKTPNSRAIAPFLQSISSAAKALESREVFSEYLMLVSHTKRRTTPKVHGIDSMYPSACLVEFLKNAPRLFGLLSLRGLKNWVEYGIRSHASDPDAQRDYFSLKTPDSLAIMQRERHGTLFADNERRLDLYLQGLWKTSSLFVPYSLAYDVIRKPVPYYDDLGIHLPDVYDDLHDVPGIDRYRALLAHLCAHLRWSSPVIADNLSPFQRMAVEVFEDSRVEHLAMREYPGLSKLWKKLHPAPKEGACPEGWSAIRHRLFMLSRAILDPDHAYSNPFILKYEKLFREMMGGRESSTEEMVELGVKFIAETRTQTDLAAKMYFEDTEVDYRDDNRLMWRFIEEGDEEVYENKPTRRIEKKEMESLPPRLYPEWNQAGGHYLPDWVSVYEHLHPKGDPGRIDDLLAKHANLAKKIGKIIDLLKPQNRVRIRYQEDGSELDIDVAIRSLIDFKSGAQPDSRINMNHRHDGRSIAVSLLLDLSASLADIPEGCSQSKLELSREAVSLLAWAVERIGDPLAIGGFHSDTRHEVRYLHIKGYGEHWGEEVKGRLSAMDAGFSTRMGAAIRHAGHYLSRQNAEKKLLLVLTDGEPADVDSSDPKHLIDDARVAVRELDMKGIYTYCISLDPAADEYVSDIFGTHYTVIDDVASLPDRLPGLFMALTK